MLPIRVLITILVASLVSATPVLADHWPHTKNEKVRSLLHKATFAKDLEYSLKSYKKAVKIEPGCPDIYHSRAVVLESHGLYREALKDINKALKLDPKDVYFYILRARIRYHLEMYKQALADVDMVYKSHSRFRSNEHQRIEGACLYHLGRYKEALEVLSHNSTYLNGGGKSIEAYYYLGMCQIALNKPKEALKSFDIAINTRPKSVRREYYLARAEAHEMLGKKELAVYDREAAKKIAKVSWSAF